MTTATATTKKSPATPATPPAPAPAVITLAKHRIELYHAYAVGADSVNRISTMIDAALVITKSENAPDFRIYMLTKFLKECEYMSDDLAGMLESERDSQAQYAAEQEGQQ